MHPILGGLEKISKLKAIRVTKMHISLSKSCKKPTFIVQILELYQNIYYTLYCSILSFVNIDYSVLGKTSLFLYTWPS